MAQSSRNERKMRRLKRERTLLMRMADKALNDRDVARMVANAAIKEIDNLNKKLNPDTEIKTVDEPEDNQANRPNTDSSGLEVPPV